MTDNSVKPLKVDNEYLPMHSSYSFELQKVYVSEPSRNNSGQIAVFPDKFFVPYFTVTWAVLSMENYKKIMKLTERDENTIEYYDSTDNSYKTAKFYAQQPTFNQLYSMKKQYNMVINLQIVFAGTLNEIGDVTVEYNANGGVGTVSSQTGINGEEFVISSGTTLSRLNYVLDSWNTQSDGSGQTYQLGAVAAFSSNMTLYAQWKTSDSYTIGLSYGYASGNATIDTKSISVGTNGSSVISGLPTNVIVANSGTNDEIIDPDGNSVYSFIGWNKLSQSVGEGTYVSNGMTISQANIYGNTTLYAHFDIREYTITFDTRTYVEYESITAEFGTKISLPVPSRTNYTFDGWYYLATDEDGSTSEQPFTSTTMPYRNLALYAKWSEV